MGDGGGGCRRPAKTLSALITTVTHAVYVHNLFYFCPLNLNAKLTKKQTIFIFCIFVLFYISSISL